MRAIGSATLYWPSIDNIIYRGAVVKPLSPTTNAAAATSATFNRIRICPTKARYAVASPQVGLISISDGRGIEIS